ncbi:MAG: tyrosine-type recombinase/integrase [Candidatus Bathyarchaeia archaeon]
MSEKPKIIIKDILSDPTVQVMLSKRSLSGETPKNYVKGLKFFCEYYGLRPSEVLERFKRLNEDEIVEEFSGFFAWAKDRVAPKSAWGWLPGIKAWLVENGVRGVDRVSREIAREFKRKFGSVKPLLKRDVVSKEEIVRLLKVAELRERAIICAMVSGGFRLSTCLGLRLKHFRDDVFNIDLPCYAVEIPENLNKEREPYVTFISAEAADYIRTHLIMRQGRGEQITPETPIFAAERGGRALTGKRFENIWRELCNKAGLDMRPVPIKGIHKVAGGKSVNNNAVRYNTRIHSLRKFFKTACSISGVDRMASEAFLGHSLTKFGVESLYDFCISNIEWMRNEYLKVLPAVTFLKEVPAVKIMNHEARERISQLEEENKALKNELNEIKRQISEIRKAFEKLLK